MQKPEGFEELRQLAIEHVWQPMRPYNVFSSPGGFTIFTEGKGCRLTDINGKTYLDYWGSIAGFNAVGYGRKEIADAAYEQMVRLHHAPTHEPTVPRIKLAANLAEITPGSLSKVFFANGGTEAVETALKIAWKYQRLSGFPNRRKVISTYTYHGSTFGAMSTGWHPPFTWEDFEPLMPGMIHVARPWCSRCDFGLEYGSCNLACVKQVEKVIQEEIPETVAAFIDTPISSEVFYPPQEYWPMVRSICDKYGVLLCVDEVVQAFGRSGKMFGMENFGVVPDIMTIGKALTSGYISLGASIATKEVAQNFEGGPKEQLHHSYTFEGHPVACAVALANIEIIEREKLVERSATMGKYLFDQLQSLWKHPIVGDIRGGRGLMAAIELVKDRKTKQQFSPAEDTKIRGMLKAKLTQAGLWGMFVNPISIVPALIITKDEIDQIVTTMDRVIGEIGKELSIG